MDEYPSCTHISCTAGAKRKIGPTTRSSAANSTTIPSFSHHPLKILPSSLAVPYRPTATFAHRHCGDRSGICLNPILSRPSIMFVQLSFNHFAQKYCRNIILPQFDTTPKHTRSIIIKHPPGGISFVFLGAACSFQLIHSRSYLSRCPPSRHGFRFGPRHPHDVCDCEVRRGGRRHDLQRHR